MARSLLLGSDGKSQRRDNKNPVPEKHSLSLEERECEESFYNNTKRFWRCIRNRSGRNRVQVTDASISRLERYQRVECIKQHFWKRFNIEYISNLQQKTKWPASTNGDIALGSLVLIKDKALPPLCWSLGRVAKVYPGSDGVTRVAELKTKRGTIRRGFNNICPLPLWSTLQPGEHVYTRHRCRLPPAGGAGLAGCAPKLRTYQLLSRRLVGVAAHQSCAQGSFTKMLAGVAAQKSAHFSFYPRRWRSNFI